MKEIQSDHKVMKSAKGDFSRLKLNFACEAKTMGASDIMFESKLIKYSAGTSLGPTRGPGLLEPFRLGGLDQPGCRGSGMW